MFHNDDLKYILDNVAESFHMETFFFSLLIPQITNENVKALLCYNYKKGNLQTIRIWSWSLPHCPWDPWKNPWRFHPVEFHLIHIWLISIAGEWLNMHSKSLVFHYRHEVIVHGGIIKIHSDSDDYSIHFRRIPFSFHPSYVPQGNRMYQHTIW